MADSTDPTAPPEASAAPAQPPAGAAPSRIELLHRAALGPVNLQHYLRVFARFDAVGRRLPVWHLPAALCTFNWLLFRRLWWEAAVYVLAMAGLLGLCAVLWNASSAWPVGVRAGLVGSLLLLGLLAPGWMGHALLHRQLQRRVLRAVRSVQTMDEAVRLLQRQASSVQRLQLLVLGNAALAAALLLGLPRCCPGALETALNLVLPAAGRTPLAPLPGTAQPLPAVAAQAAVAPARPALPPAAQTTVATKATAASSATFTASSSARFVTPTDTTPAAIPAPAPAAATAATIAAAAAPGPVAMVASTVDAATVMAAPTGSPASAVPTARKTPPAGAEGPGRFAINVGLFAQPDNASRVFDRLQQAGLPATLEVVRTPQGERSRVRVGPFYAGGAAQAAAQRIRALGLEAVVFQQP